MKAIDADDVFHCEMCGEDQHFWWTCPRCRRTENMLYSMDSDGATEDDCRNCGETVVVRVPAGWARLEPMGNLGVVWYQASDVSRCVER